MKKKKTIMVDMDEVITTGGLLYLINKFLGTNYKEADFKTFYMQDIVPNKDDFFKFFIKENMYNYGYLLDNVREVLKELNEQYDIYIGTSYLFPEIPDKCGHILLQKFEYLRENLPFISPYRYIFVCDKSILKFDIKIDDNILNLSGSKKKFLFTSYHNLNIPKEELDKQNIERVNNWIEIKNILLKEH